MKYNIKEEELRAVVETSKTISDVLRKLNIVISGGNYKLIKKLCKEYNIDITHFDGKSWRLGQVYDFKIKTEYILENKFEISRNQLKKRLLDEGLLEYKCKKCGNIGEWMGEKISLELDHINGVNNDNRLENLRILCPNCHSQTQTYRNKNKKIEKIVKPNNLSDVFMEKKLCRCGKEIRSRSKNCIECNSIINRKVKRPNIDELILAVKNSSYLAVSKKYGVSDNTIRKWIKKHSPVAQLVER